MTELTGSVSFGLRWTVFDGGARKGRVAQARADIHAAEAQTNLKKNQIADEVWTAYSNLNTAFRQQRAAVALLEAASQSYNAALESYKYGLRNLLDVTAAQRSLGGADMAIPQVERPAYAFTHSGPLGTCQTPRPGIGM